MSKVRENYTHWTPDLDNKLREECNKKTEVKAIPAVLGGGITESAVRDRIQKLGLGIRKLDYYQPFNYQEIANARILSAQGLTFPEIAKELGKSYSLTRRTLLENGILGKRSSVTDAEKANFKQLQEDGKTLDEIEILTKRSKNTIRKYITPKMKG